MWIHLLRHGIAIDRDDPACPTDPQRFLTPKGKERTRASVRGFATVEPVIDAVFVSPYRRAQETADIAVEELGLEDLPRHEIAALVPMGEPAEVVQALQRETHRGVLVVGHAPNLDRVAGFLVGSDRGVTALKKAGVASVEASHPAFGTGSLYAVYPAALLRNLAHGRS